MYANKYIINEVLKIFAGPDLKVFVEISSRNV